MTKKKGSKGQALPSKTRLGSAKKILIGIGSLGLSSLSYSAQEDILTVLPPPAGVTSQFSPRTRELIEDTLKALKVATGGKDDGRSIGQAIAAVKENRPEISLPVMCTAVLQLGLKEEAAQAKWADVQSQYQRRADLIPNLVETVKGTLLGVVVLQVL